MFVFRKLAVQLVDLASIISTGEIFYSARAKATNGEIFGHSKGLICAEMVSNCPGYLVPMTVEHHEIVRTYLEFIPESIAHLGKGLV
jgi:hypothetical protein